MPESVNGAWARTLTIGSLAWAILTAIFCGPLMATDESWLGRHSGTIVWALRGLVLVAAAAAATRGHRSLGIVLVIAGAAAYLCFVVLAVSIATGAGRYSSGSASRTMSSADSSSGT